MRKNQSAAHVNAASPSLLESLSWLPLSPEELQASFNYYGRKRGDIDRWYIDKDLACALDQVNREAARRRGRKMYEQAEFSAALRDREFTKFFVNWDNTLANFEHFLDERCTRPDGRWRKDYKAAVRLILKSVEKMPQLSPVRLETEEDVLNVFGDANTSVGFGARGSKKDNIPFITKAFKNLKSRVANWSNHTERMPRGLATVAHRAQISGFVSDDGKHYVADSKRKDRGVLMVEGPKIAFEGQYAVPWNKAASQHWWNYSGGDDPDRLREKIRYSADRSTFWFQTDFSKFDQTIPDWLIYGAFDIIKTKFPKEYHHEIAWIAQEFVNLQILLPGGKMIEKHRGISSGSYFTQAIGSLCNALLLLSYLCSKVKGSIDDKVHWVWNQLHAGENRPMTFQVMGDDSITFLDKAIDLKDMSNYLWSLFGVTMSEDKTTTSRDQKWPQYLKREWRRGGEWRNPLELVIGVTHPEFERTYDGYSPWHIIYGLWKTYRFAFPDNIPELWFVEQMNNAPGGIDALVDLKARDLPGPLRGYGDKARLHQWLSSKALLARNLAA